MLLGLRRRLRDKGLSVELRELIVVMVTVGIGKTVLSCRLVSSVRLEKLLTKPTWPFGSGSSGMS